MARHPIPVRSRRVLPDELRTRTLAPEAFFEFVEYEAARHARHLGGIALVRIAPRHGRRGADPLKEAVETELRRTDVACRYPDGSHIILVGEADRHTAEIVAQRLVEVAGEIDAAHAGPAAEFAVGIGASQGRRVTAEELWAAADDELAVERDTHPPRTRELLDA